MEATQYRSPGAQRTTENHQRERHAMEDDPWSIAALRDVNSLAVSIALKKSLIPVSCIRVV
jgi:hypothetical protein